MSRETFAQGAGLLAALVAGALLVEVTAPTAAIESRTGLMIAWGASAITLTWAGGSLPRPAQRPTQPRADRSWTLGVRFLRASLLVVATIVCLVTF
jgi:hypothetical protein